MGLIPPFLVYSTRCADSTLWIVILKIRATPTAQESTPGPCPTPLLPRTCCRVPCGVFLGCLNAEIAISRSNYSFMLPEPHPSSGHRPCRGNQPHPECKHSQLGPGRSEPYSWQPQGALAVPEACSVLTQKGFCLSGTGVFLCESQLVSLGVDTAFQRVQNTQGSWSPAGHSPYVACT